MRGPRRAARLSFRGWTTRESAVASVFPSPSLREQVNAFTGVCIAISLAAVASAAEPQRPTPLKSGIEFVSADIRALQADDFANPGMLWVVRGEKLWQDPAGSGGKSCASCHGDAKAGMRGAATRYPLLDPGTARLINLEGRIMQCRERRQQAAPLNYESDDLLALTAFVAMQSRGMPVNVSIDWQNRGHFEAGRAMFYRRLGQMNLSCAQCHQDNWGKKLGPETISQGHGNAYPVYRLEWQTAGSLHRKFRTCLSGVRAGMLPYGAPEYLDLELYLAWRASGLPVETPGVRR
ncbi:MAG: sulfur oxidation c-type cytochrome SoxA [Betaproteobacteria bacterium]|nr:MAG: sulfur oxidation c-type cytochrome SoxA [Betaproteobacteria bacterium]